MLNRKRVDHDFFSAVLEEPFIMLSIECPECGTWTSDDLGEFNPTTVRCHVCQTECDAYLDVVVEWERRDE